MTTTQHLIREHLARAGRLGIDTRHVEAWMRTERPTLDALSPRGFQSEALAAADCVAQAGPEMSEALAATFGL